MLEKLGLIPISEIIKNKSIQNFLFLAIIQSSNILITIISMPLLIQGIGVDQFGLVNLALSIIVLLNIMVGFGYNLSAPREVAVNQNDNTALSHLLSNIFSAKILLAGFATLLIFLGVFGLNIFKEYSIILVYSVLLLFSEATLPVWFFQGMEKMKLVSIANIFSKLLFLMGIVLFIHSPEMSKWVNFMMGFSGLIINLFLLVYIHTFLKIRFYRPQFSAIWASLKENGLFFFSNLASHISINGGLIILSFFSTAEILGMYSLAERIMMVLRIFPPMVVQAIYPNCTKLFKKDQKLFHKFLKRVYLNMLVIGFLITAGTYFLAPWIIKILSKSDLEESVNFLRILSFVPFLACLNAANVTIMLVADLKKLLFKASWMMSAYMIFTGTLLTFLLGPIGISIAVLTTEVAVFIICLILLFRNNRELFHEFYS